MVLGAMSSSAVGFAASILKIGVMPAHHFDAQYHERSRLEDGTEVVLRLVGPQDKALLVDGFARLSPQARYRRFFSTKRHLTPAELRYFTELDGENHLALGAVRLRSDGSEEGVGVARFVRASDDPHAAEAAVVVVDEFQQKGLGRLLLSRLVGAARERGIERFRATTLVENPAARALIAEVGGVPHASLGGDTLSVEVTLPSGPPAGGPVARTSSLYRLFQAIAQGVADLIEPDAHG
jgi:RimJ/RimL family protein N-acetyltransferase